MIRFSYDCPWCGEKHTGFKIISAIDGEKRDIPHNAFHNYVDCCGAAQCLCCDKFIVFSAEILLQVNESLHGMVKYDKTHTETSHEFSITKKIKKMLTYPSPPQPNIPQHLPEKVETLFNEGEHARIQGQIGARCAVSSYRAVIDNMFQDLIDKHEIAIKGDKGPGIQRYTKVEKLIEAHIIPETFKDWTQQKGIAKILNCSAHGNEVSVDVTKEIADIVRFMLIYIYELPGRIAQARQDFGE